MNHISLETAKKLHSLGWRKRTSFYWDSERGYVCHQFNAALDTGLDIAAPLAEEILEVLPYATTLLKEASYYIAMSDGKPRRGSNPAEALALLLIDLVEQGVVSRESLSSKE